MGESGRAGSVQYMAPEVLSKINIKASGALDSWSLGCILFEMLSGRPLFEGTYEEIKKAVINHEQIPAKMFSDNGISVEAIDLILSLTKKHKKERLTVLDALKHCWIKNEKFDLNANISNESSYVKEMKQHSMKRFSSQGLVKIHRRNTEMTSGLNKINCPGRQLSFRNRNESRGSQAILSLHTKVQENLKESALLDFNLTQLRNNGKIQSYLQPIGHTKEQKQNVAKYQTFIKNYQKELTTHSTFIRSKPRTKTTGCGSSNNEALHKKIVFKSSDNLPNLTVPNLSNENETGTKFINKSSKKSVMLTKDTPQKQKISSHKKLKLVDDYINSSLFSVKALQSDFNKNLIKVLVK